MNKDTSYRTQDKLTSKWGHINCKVQKFIGVYEECARSRRSETNDADVFRLAATRYQDDGHQGKVPIDLWRILSRSPKWQQLNNSDATSSKKRSSVDTEVEVDDTIGSSEQRSPFSVADSNDEDPIPRPIGRKKAKSIASGSGGSGSISVSSHDNISRAMVEQVRMFNIREEERARRKQEKEEIEIMEGDLDTSLGFEQIGMGEQEGGLYYFKEPEKKMVCSAKKESKFDLWHKRLGHPSSHVLSLVPEVGTSASLDTGTTNEVSSYDEDEELRTEERMDRSRRNGRPEESGRADRLQTVDLMDRSDVHGRPSERQDDGFLRDDRTVDLVDRPDIHGRPSERQNDGSLGDDQTVDRYEEDGRPSLRQIVSDPEQLQTVDPVDRSTDGSRPSSSQQAVENLGRGQREKRPNVRLADYVTHVAGSHVGEKCKYPLASDSFLFLFLY
ncbi:unnamed protein product [Cuscuta campestris]|uniref:No apical meristem-associated C-terminal domain-containing protein n=1 Tax=Cuscuta campestris TaxID=132261 RepID=A0A484MSL1_9ASTE|nr:unnamed protein product [Cuscuta campestris]